MSEIEEILTDIRSTEINVNVSLDLLKKPCSDCAVTCGLYKRYSDAYKYMPDEEQLLRSKRWFCHNNTSKACRGHADNLGIKW